MYVVRDGIARLTPVRVGYSNGSEAEVLSGLDHEGRLVGDPAGLAGDAVPVEVEPTGRPK